MVDAGFYFVGSCDRVCYFYCGVRLFYCKPCDNLCYEHANWFPLCEFVLTNLKLFKTNSVCGVNCKLCGKILPEAYQFTPTRNKNSTRCVAANRLRNMLFHQMRNMAAAEQRKQRLKNIMLFDSHVKYAKSIGLEDTKIRYALLKQLEKNNWNFPNCQELQKVILNLKIDDICMKCKNAEKTAAEKTGALLNIHLRHPLYWLSTQRISEKICVFQC